MVKGGVFYPLKHEKPLKNKDFCVRVQNCCPIMAPRTGLEPVTSWLTVMRSTDWAIGEYRIRTKIRTESVSINLFYREVFLRVSSARDSLTTVFGMGTGVPWPRKSPTENLWQIHRKPNKEWRSKGSSSYRSISIGQLNTSLYLHFRPIKHVVYMWPV